MSELGYSSLSQVFDVTPAQPFTTVSEIGRSRSSALQDGVWREVYPESYRPDPTFSGQLTFALKYEGVHLEFLARLFALDEARRGLEHWIKQAPTSVFARRAGFFCEWLNPKPLDFAGVGQGNYIDALDPGEYVTGRPINNRRWRVRDNLPGSRDFCPTVRRTEAVNATESYDIAAQLDALEADFGLDLIRRGSVWLTVKESRASFLIEHEHNQEERIQRFAAVMENECGKHPNPFDKETLAGLQRGILGDKALRYGIRRSPVYVGHNAQFQAVVDYIAPHWDGLDGLLQGLAGFLDRTPGGSPIVRAAVAAFGFVYVHPMADGNGRISRFLVNDILRRDGIVPSSIILPISATISKNSRHQAAYDRALEAFSKPLMRRYAGDWRFGELAVTEDGVEYNFHFQAYEDALPTWSYPDLTEQTAYLAGVIDETLTIEMKEEARFLRANDNARRAIKAFLEAPDNELDGIIRSVRENRVISSKLAKRHPVLLETPGLADRIIQAVDKAFAG